MELVDDEDEDGDEDEDEDGENSTARLDCTKNGDWCSSLSTQKSYRDEHAKQTISNYFSFRFLFTWSISGSLF